MGFKNGAFATVWSAAPGKFDNTARVRLTTSRKNKKTDTYEQDFGSFCTFIGEAAKAALRLKERDRIRLKSVDVTNNWDKENDKTWVDYKVFEFEMADGTTPSGDDKKATAAPKKKAAIAEEGEVEEDELPF